MIKIKKPSKKIAIIATLLAIGLVVFLVLTLRNNNDRNTDSQTQTTPTSEENFIDLDPPTQEDLNRADSNKDRIVNEQEKQPQTPESGTIKNVNVTITYAGQYGQAIEIGGFTDIVENNGVCKATFTKDSLTVAKEVNAVVNAQSTDCPTISLPTSDFTQKGNWNVKLEYLSPNSKGVSEERTIQVN